MSAILALKDYGGSEEGSEEEEEEEEELAAVVHFRSKMKVVNSAPDVASKEGLDHRRHMDPTSKEISVNLKYDELFAPTIGPENPFKTQQQKAHKNMLSGYVEPACFNDFHFESQRRTFTSYGYALDPTVDHQHNPNPNLTTGGGEKFVGERLAAEENQGVTVFEAKKVRPATTAADGSGNGNRKRQKNSDAGDIDGFLGPWGGYVGEQKVSKPSVEEQDELDEIIAKRQKRGKNLDDKPMEEKTVLHIKDAFDYQGRSFLHVPQDVGVNLKSDEPPDKCFIPKKQIHTWTGHSKGVSAIRWFPKSAHLMLSCSMDSKVKLWEVYNERRCIRTYVGHRQAVRDVSFNNSGSQFLSAGYDRYIKLWDTEKGECISRYTSRKIAYCVKFNPDEDKQHLFVAGTSDKKIVCWDTRSDEIVQEYDRHLGAVNSITFVDDNRRFVSTSDDKSMRVWEWDIPVDMKYIADPTMHSMPSVTLSPNGKWLACQAMDNKIVIFSALNRFKINRKKTFMGHMVAGYACSLDFSPDMSYLSSGDADGKVYVWDWKTTKLYKKFKAHDSVCIGVLWHPHETSKLATAGWDGTIKYWD